MWETKEMLQRRNTQHALYSVLAPPIILTTTTTKKRRKEIFLKIQKTLQRTREWDTSGLHQSISLQGGWELASSECSSRVYDGRTDRRQ